MSRAILLSIRPEWVAKILNGEKTIEIRKTCPAIFKHLKSYEGAKLDVFMYVTQGDDILVPTYCGYQLCKNSFYEPLNGKVVAKFTLRKIKRVSIWDKKLETETLKPACLDFLEFDKYTKGQVGYAWHIEDLVIFDRPKELSEFKGACPIEKGGCRLCKYGGIGLSSMPLCRKPQLTKAPQSWCYIEGEEKICLK